MVKALTTFWGLLLALALTSPAVQAWGTEGHQVIALIAQARLTPAARAQVAQLLAQEAGATLVSVASWADEHKSPATAPWHYVNFPNGQCVYDAARDCPDGHCVVAAIQKQMHVLGSHASDAHKLVALKYLVHLVGDVHQPLHAGHLDDRGGNRYPLREFMRGSNLHAVWDSGLIHYLDETPEVMARRIQPVTEGIPLDMPDPVTAAQESCNIVALPGFYPDHQIDARYIAQFTPLMERRLATAGARLASLLNQAF